jgi:alpha-tubulin suppressor-like RCC1 family protein
VSSVSLGRWHALALAEDGLVYAWGRNTGGASLGNPNLESELLPTPVEALRGVRVGSVAAGGNRSYAVAETGEVWAWGIDSNRVPPLGHGEFVDCPVPKPIVSLQGVKVDAVAAFSHHTLALADNGSVYAWAGGGGAEMGLLGRDRFTRRLSANRDIRRLKIVPTPQLVPELRMWCRLACVPSIC